MLVLGVVTTVAVSWSLAMWRRVPMYPSHAQASKIGWVFVTWDRTWSNLERRLVGVTDVWWDNLESDYPGKSQQQLIDMCREQSTRWPTNPYMNGSEFRDWAPPWGTFKQRNPLPLKFVIGGDIAFGWPMPCLWQQVIAETKKTNTGIRTINPELHGGILVGGQVDCPGYTNFRALPLLPVWSAFAIDVVFYSLMWTLLLFAPGAFRRAHRRRHNRCERCGYSLAGNPASERGCSECGWNRSSQ